MEYNTNYDYIKNNGSIYRVSKTDEILERYESQTNIWEKVPQDLYVSIVYDSENSIDLNEEDIEKI